MSMFPLLAGKMKIAGCVGVAGLSLISVPTTLSVTSFKGANEFLRPLNEKVNEAGSKYFNGFDQKLQAQYVGFGKRVIGDTKQGLDEAGTKIKAIRTIGEASIRQVNDNGEDINYYAFRLGDLIKAVIRQMPTIIRDSAIDAFTKGTGSNLLSAQKIYAIAKNEKFKEFVESLSKVITDYEDIMSKITNKDLDGVMQIFKELPSGNIGEFLGKIKNNSEDLDSDRSSYCNATKLMMHVLIGKREINKIKETVSQLKTTLEGLESSLKGILEAANVDIEDFKSQLDTLSKSPKIQDPCPK